MILVDIFNTTSILKHMHILQPFCIAVFLSLFRHNKTPKVFCLTFGVHVIFALPFLFLGGVFQGMPFSAIIFIRKCFWIQNTLYLCT